MKKIESYLAHPSAAAAVKAGCFTHYKVSEKVPVHGDVFYGEVTRVGDDSQVENKSGRLHHIREGSRSLFVFANRYAPDYFEGFVPDRFVPEVDLLERSGVCGLAACRHTTRLEPTRIKVLGYVCDETGGILNTRGHSLLRVRAAEKKKEPRAPMILVVGTAMNAGKTMAASACCRVLSRGGMTVNAGKATGMASLKELFQMSDNGAAVCADFTHLGVPATYLLDRGDMLHIFHQLDLHLADNPEHVWVLELADGINQRETAMLLDAPAVRERIHKLIFCAADPFGVIGGLHTLKERFGLEADAVSGLCSSSPLYLRELAELTDIPIFKSAETDIPELRHILAV